MGGILSLQPEGIEERIHPRALEHFRKFQADVRFAVPLEGITEADLNEHLRNDEKYEFQRYMSQITDGLRTCIDIGDGDSSDNQIKISLFKLNTTIPMYWVKLLLGRVSDRKLEKGREEARRQAEEAKEKQRQEEEQERQRAAEVEAERKKKELEKLWDAAYKALNVPTADAKKYLAEPGEYKKFIKSIAEAVRAYMDKGESYTNDSRAKDYLFYCDVINRREDKEQRKLAAAVSAQLFSYSLNQQIEKLKARLHVKKQGLSKYFSKDSRYKGHRFLSLLSSDDKKELSDIIDEMVGENLADLLPGDLAEYISWSHTQFYRLLPTVDYRLDGVPCLNIWFETEIVAEVEIWLKPGKKSFGDYTFKLPVIDQGDYSIELREPKFLGYHYIHFATSSLPKTFWQAIPVSLIASLSDADVEPSSVTILEASESAVTYRIKGFEKAVIVPAIFTDFLKAVGGLAGMASIGVMSQKVADIVLREVTEVGTVPRKQISESVQLTAWSNEDFHSKMAELYYSRKVSDVLLQHIPKSLSLDEAVKWSLEHYSKIIAENGSSE